MAIGVFKIELQGFSGAPGVNVVAMSAVGPLDSDFTQAEATSASTILQAVYDSCKGLYAPGVKAVLEPVVRVINPADGTLLGLLGVGGWTVNASTAPSAGAESRATQAKMQFFTDGIRGNRAVRGGIYFGPLSGDALAQDGSVQQSARNALADAWDGALDVLGPRLVVWSRKGILPGESQPTDGQASFVQSVNVKALPAVMTSRRD